MPGTLDVLARGLFEANHHKTALSVQEAELAMMQRLGDSAQNILSLQGNLAITYSDLGHTEKALSMERDVYTSDV